MKSILVPIDFLPPAENAAHYALKLAQVLGADLTLCHSFIVPIETPIQQVGWPAYEYSEMQKSTLEELNELAVLLKKQEQSYAGNDSSLKPLITCKSEGGTVSDLVHHLVRDPIQTMIVLGMAGAGAISRFFLGSISHHLINHSPVSLLLIPNGVKLEKIKRIAFATDLRDEDLEVIRSLTGLAEKYDADLVISNVTDEWENEQQHHEKERLFLDHLMTSINYPNFYMRNISSVDIEDGLEELSREYKIDMMVMVHRNNSFMNRLFKGSFSQDLARHIKIPLMVIPENLWPVF